MLGWRAWIPLSRITFCAYLIHPILLQIYYLSRPHAFHFTTVYQMVRSSITSVFLPPKKRRNSTSLMFHNKKNLCYKCCSEASFDLIIM